MFPLPDMLIWFIWGLLCFGWGWYLALVWTDRSWLPAQLRRKSDGGYLVVYTNQHGYMQIKDIKPDITNDYDDA
jgi:hypothetical protein